MKLSDQALGAIMMALQRSLMEQSDIVPVLKGFKLEETDLAGIKIPNFEKTYDKNRPRELTSNDLQHPNIIKLEESAFQTINGQIFHLTSKF